MDALRRAQALLLYSSMILIAIGVVMIYSASAIYAYDQMKDSAYFLERHVIYLALGIFAALFASSMDLEKFRRHSKKILVFALVLMVAVLIPHVGHSTGGARRWFKLLGFSVSRPNF